MKERNPMVKVWIQDHDLHCIEKNTKPSRFWFYPPSYLQNIVELTLPWSAISEWEMKKSKILLKD